MPRYYFDLRHAHLHVPDRRGEECVSAGEALEYAVVAVLDLVKREGRFRNWSKWSIEIKDEDGNRVAVLPFALVTKRSPCLAD